MKNLQQQLDEIRVVLQAVLDYVGNEQILAQIRENEAKRAAAAAKADGVKDGAAVPPAEENGGTATP